VNFAEGCASCDEGFAQSGDVFGVEYDFGAFAAWRGWAGMEGDVGGTCGEFAPAFFVGDLFEAEDVSVEVGHCVDLGGEEDYAG
jgi:hypothetical protein